MMNNESCSTTKPCSTKKWLIGALVVFVVTMAYDWLVHGNLLMGLYRSIENLSRPYEEMKAMYGYCIAKHALQALLFAGAYGCWRSKVTMGAVGSKDCPYKKSMGFGLWIGLMLGINEASTYIYVPIPANLALAWLATETVKWILAAVALSALCGCCNKDKAAA
jgi:hypothetical protein